MDIAIFGTGYVGLVTGTCLAEMGNTVTCVDVDEAKILRLRSGILPIHEPGLQELLSENSEAGRLRFSTLASDGMMHADIAFICVGTPMSSQGEADLRYVRAAAHDIGRHMTRSCLVVTKSTVPVGTSELVRHWVAETAAPDVTFAVASNPEFLKEGSAVDDFMKPDRVVVGVDDPRSESTLHDLYAPFIRNGLRFYALDLRSAEMTKYAANCMLATKISFINEIANICELVGADVRGVRQGIGADSRIGLQFLHPGIGYGGSCFPKDVRALIHTAKAHGYQPDLLATVDAINDRQRQLVQRKILTWCDLHERKPQDLTVAVWGLAFKPNTDDVREAPALGLITALSAFGARVRASDPKAIEACRSALGALPGVSYHSDHYEATQGADILCLMTEWRSYRRPDFKRLAEQVASRTIFDGRNQYEEDRCRRFGISLILVGVPQERTSAMVGTAQLSAPGPLR